VETDRKSLDRGFDKAHSVFVVTADHAGERLDRFLAAASRDLQLSRTRLKALIQAGQVLVDGSPAIEPSVSVRAGQVVSLTVPEAADPVPRGEAIALEIVYEDAHLLVIDKPAGLVVHPAAGHDSGTLVNALIAHCGESLSGIGGVRRPGIVHRLDKDTSGLLVVAKTDVAHKGLARLFADHGETLPLEREYLAFCWGVPDRPAGTIEASLARHPREREKIAVVANPKGRRAVTDWQIVETYGKEASLVACRLRTGRTHQIRVHLAHIGHALLGDPVYSKGLKSKEARLVPAARSVLGRLARQALHAAVLGFEHPVTGRVSRFVSALPADLQALRDALSSASDETEFGVAASEAHPKSVRHKARMP
jgi:23S rRNA pseudouridine1911/1915/1917 synthase